MKIKSIHIYAVIIFSCLTLPIAIRLYILLLIAAAWIYVIVNEILII